MKTRILLKGLLGILLGVSVLALAFGFGRIVGISLTQPTIDVWVRETAYPFRMVLAGSFGAFAYILVEALYWWLRKNGQ